MQFSGTAPKPSQKCNFSESGGMLTRQLVIHFCSACEGLGETASCSRGVQEE